MNAIPTANEIRSIASLLDGWELPDDFQMPTLEEIENDLALGQPAWRAFHEHQTSAGPDPRRLANRTQRQLPAQAPRPLTPAVMQVIGHPIAESLVRVRRHVLAVAAVLAVSACLGTPAADTTPAASPTPTPATWPEDLTLVGDVTGHATATMPNAGATTSSCTGKYSIAGYSLILVLSTDQGVFQLFVSVPGYRGPGTYANGTGQSPEVRGGIINPERTSSWTAVPGDRVTLTVDSSQESGTIDASFSDHNHQTAVVNEVVRGRWTCRSGT